jgi:hypothetical protein
LDYHQKTFAMQTLLVQVNSRSAYRLLEDLEALRLISVKRKGAEVEAYGLLMMGGSAVFY